MYFLFLAVFLSVPFLCAGHKKGGKHRLWQGPFPSLFHGKKPYPILII